jgi:hypothetical protein
MKKSDINERVEKLNKIYSKVKNLKINIEVKTKHNEKNLEKFREILKPADVAI